LRHIWTWTRATRNNLYLKIRVRRIYQSEANGKHLCLSPPFEISIMSQSSPALQFEKRFRETLNMWILRLQISTAFGPCMDLF